MAKINLGRVSILLDNGTTSIVQVKSQSYTDVDITFEESFTAIPLVLLTIVADSKSYRYGGLQCSVLNRKKTGFTLRVFNNSDIQLAPTLNWCAIERT